MISLEKTQRIQGLSRHVSKAKKSQTSRKKSSWRAILTLVTFTVLVVLAGSMAWLQMPMGFKPDAVKTSSGVQVLDLAIEPGTTPKGVAQAISDAGVNVSPPLLRLWFRLSGQDRAIKAGSYEITPEMSPKGVLNMLVRGEESLKTITLVEGWTFKQFKQALAKAETLKFTTQTMTDADIMAKLGRPNIHPEGRFYPDSYTYSKGSTDLAVMQRALKAMDRHLENVWAQKPAHLKLMNPEELLILASIVEKETGRASDRPMISAVFHNRLKIGMRLQTDPTVIYGLGDSFDGNLRRVDLRTDTPYNTYTRSGLPPTPIAMPGKAALIAAISPAPSSALYFVAKGDGTSHFSQTLNEHNNAVNKYQRGLSKEGQ